MMEWWNGENERPAARRRNENRGCQQVPVILATTLLLLGTSSVLAWAEAPSLARYRTGTPDPRVHRVPGDVQRGVFADPERYVEPLVRSLLSGIDDDFHKCKILHDWIAEHIAYDVESYLSGKIPSSTWKPTLRARRGVCHGYAELMKKLCGLAGIPCERIKGYGRGYSFRPGDDENLGRSNHAWNAVYLGGRWHLVDVTWDAGHVSGTAYRKRYSTAYLFPAPSRFVYTHLPAEPKWQLLSPRLTREQFAELPYLSGRFFEHRLRLLTALKQVNRMRDSVQFAIEVPEDVQIRAGVKPPNGEELDRRALVQRDGPRTTVLATFPRPGRWLVRVFSKRRDEDGPYWRCASFVFDTTSGTARTFPETYGAYQRLGASLERPLYVPIATGRPTSFRIRVPGASEVNLVIDKRWQKLRPVAGQDDLFELSAAIPQGAWALLVAKPPGSDGGHQTLLSFTPDQL